MSRKVYLSLLCPFLMALSGCNKSDNQTTADSSLSPTAAPDSLSPVSYDVCTLITKEEVATIQGAVVNETKSSERAARGLRISQCFYVTAEFNKSVSLTVTKADSAGSEKRNAREYWVETFGRYANTEDKPERSKEEKRERPKEEKESPGAEREKESRPPRKIDGLGDEAYWTRSRVGGVLYVLKNDAVVRVSLGGTDSEETMISKSKDLAEKALPRL
ncbi:MAG TPA: hypothetical protein VK581_12900 [Chthoniobacterales bacterium]|nr:hypothetical protein [Chthoniobacterales bacterium]